MLAYDIQHMFNNKLAKLVKRQRTLQSDLNYVNSQIEALYEDLPEGDIEETMSAVLTDDIEFGRWLQKRREELMRNSYTVYVYALYDKNELVYYGMTEDLSRRIKAHKKSDKVFNRHKVVDTFTNRGEARKRELYLIEKHRPRYNKSLTI